MTQNKKIVKEFYQFIKSQDDNKIIDHNSWAWSGCAVGEFLAQKFNMTMLEYKEKYFDIGLGKHIDDEFHDAFELENPTLRQRLNKSHFSTYGELKKYLSTTEPSLINKAKNFFTKN